MCDNRNDKVNIRVIASYNPVAALLDLTSWGCIMRSRLTRYFVCTLTTLALLSFGTTSPSKNKEKKPLVSITKIPHSGPGAPTPTEAIGGSVKGIESNKLKDLRIVVYALARDTWYVQPTVAHPLTSIDDHDGTWETETHLGTRYAALLVKASYQAQATADAIPNLDDDVLAVARVDGK